MDASRSPRWQQAIWTGAGLGLLLTILLLLAFAGFTIFRVVELVALRSDADLAFVFSSVGVVTLTLLRLLAILIGAAIAFAGLAVSFFSHERALSASAEVQVPVSTNTKAELVAYAPGLVGLVVGALVIVCALFARSKHDYKGPETYSVVLPNATAPGASSPSGQPPSGPRPLEEVLRPKAAASNPSRGAK